MASTDDGKKEIVSWIREHFAEGSTCLDVGACDGKWKDLVGEYLVMDACEIYEPNARQIADKYRRVYKKDIAELRYQYYDLVIFGDVIEHMSVQKAQRVLEYARNHCKDLIIGVPYRYPQGDLYGNPYEVHIQDDLTADLFNERYPGYELIWGCGWYGYYHIPPV